MPTYEQFFERATGEKPYDFQAAIARDGLPDLLEVPTGAGKSAAVVLGWLWRLTSAPGAETRDATPRRLAVATASLRPEEHDGAPDGVVPFLPAF